MSKFNNYSKKSTDFDALASKFKKETSSKRDWSDDRFYYPERTKEGTASVTIRFLPDHAGIEGEELSKRIHHYFQAKNGWYVENCPKTLDLDNDCPVCDAKNKVINDAGGYLKLSEKQKTYTSPRGWKTEFVCNIMIIKDDKNPEFNGKTMLFRFGKEILTFIKKAMKPEFDDDPEAFNAYNPWLGRNFNLRVIKDEKGQTTYKKSKWLDVNDISETVDLKDMYDIHEFVSPDKFKAYPELLKRYEKVTGESLANNDSPVAVEPTERSSAPVVDPNEDVLIGEDIPDDTSGDSGDDISKYFDEM